MVDDSFENIRLDVEGVHISDDGYYTCTGCDEVVEAQGETITEESGRRRAIWKCPSCDETYEI